MRPKFWMRIELSETASPGRPANAGCTAVGKLRDNAKTSAAVYVCAGFLKRTDHLPGNETDYQLMMETLAAPFWSEASSMPRQEPILTMMTWRSVRNPRQQNPLRSTFGGAWKKLSLGAHLSLPMCVF